jgi:hypothetical protein
VQGRTEVTDISNFRWGQSRKEYDLEGFQASPTHTSDKDSLKVMILEW